MNVAWVVLHCNRRIGAKERRQLIPHVRFQVPFLGPESQLKSGFACAGLLCSTLAFTLGTPQKAPTDEQFEELGNKVYGTPTIGQLALLRKLHFEATTLMVASINEQVKSDSSDPTSLSKRLPAAEKQSRLEIQSKRLAGLRIVGELSPSHQLLDLTNAMVETVVLTWVAPSKCSKRDDEVQANIKPNPSTLQIEQATLKVAQVPVATVADVGSELKLQWALQRRGIAWISADFWTGFITRSGFSGFAIHYEGSPFWFWYDKAGTGCACRQGAMDASGTTADQVTETIQRCAGAQ